MSTHRPPFYAGTAPDAWLKTPRTGYTPAEYASPVERHVPHGMSGAAKAIAWGLTFLFALLLAGHFLAR